MSHLKESGHYAIAGFVYQVLGAGVDAFHICEKVANEASPDSLLVVERFGQDAVELPLPSSDRKPRLIQYKYSTVGETINEGDLCDILFAFLRSAQTTSISVSGFEYELFTNREYSEKAAAWLTSGGREKAENYLQTWASKHIDNEETKKKEAAEKSKSKSKSKSKFKPTPGDALQAKKDSLRDEMLTVFDSFEYRKRSKEDFERALTNVATEYGMLKEELEVGVDGVVSYLFQLSGKTGARIVLPRHLRLKLTGNGDAFKLLSEEASDKQQGDLDRFNDSELALPVIPRLYDKDLFDSVLSYPLTIVHGDGGCGKSVALSDLAATCIQDRGGPPRFCLLERAIKFTQDTVIRRVARWRNYNSTDAGETYQGTFRRLEGVCKDRPVLLVCVDAIDEKDSQMLPSECADFLVQLIKSASRSRSEDATDAPVISIVLSCRREDEHKHLTRTIQEIAPAADINYIKVSDFSDEELLSAAKCFDSVHDEIVERLGSHLKVEDYTEMRSRSASPSYVSDESLAIIRHPVLWYIFSKLTNEQQNDCLDGSSAALNRLGDEYLAWFQKKASYRINNLQMDECQAALQAAAVAVGDSGGAADYSEDWDAPVKTAGDLDKRRAKLLYEEAISAGVIAPVENSGRKWRWKQEWFCRYLLSTVEVTQ